MTEMHSPSRPEAAKPRKDPFAPRLLMVESAVTDGQGKRSVDLALLSRDASAEFRTLFPDGPGGRMGDALGFAWANSTEYIGRPLVSLRHRKRHNFEGKPLPLGHVLSEKEAFDLGYPEPHIDTVCGRLARMAAGIPRQDMFERELNRQLRESGLIGNGHFASTRGSGDGRLSLDVFVSEEDERRTFAWGTRMAGTPNRQHYASLLIFEVDLQGFLPVGCAYHSERTNTTYEFMTYVPMDR